MFPLLWIGDGTTLSQLSKIRDLAAHAGHSELVLHSKVHMPSLQANLWHSQSNSSLTAYLQTNHTTAKDAMEVGLPLPITGWSPRITTWLQTETTNTNKSRTQIANTRLLTKQKWLWLLELTWLPTTLPLWKPKWQKAPCLFLLLLVSLHSTPTSEEFSMTKKGVELRQTIQWPSWAMELLMTLPQWITGSSKTPGALTGENQVMSECKTPVLMDQEFAV